MANCPNMEEEGRCARPREILRHHTSKSHHEAAREDLGWSKSKNWVKNNRDSETAEGRLMGCLH